MLLGIIKDEMLEIKRKYADERRTEITALDGEIDMLDLIQEEDMVVTHDPLRLRQAHWP